MIRGRRLLSWHPLAAAVLAGGLSAGGTLYAASHAASHAASGPMAAWAPDASAQPAPATAVPAEGTGEPVAPVLDTSADSAGPVLESSAGDPEGSARRAAGGAPRVVMGQVTQVSQDPPAFTVRAQGGAEVTYRVLEISVFDAGYDRPYNFGLLKVGDGVRVVGGVPAQAPGQAAKPGAAQSERARPRQVYEVDGQPVARRVGVRPAGEPQRGPAQKVGRPGAPKPGQKEENDGAGR